MGESERGGTSCDCILRWKGIEGEPKEDAVDREPKVVADAPAASESDETGSASP